MAKARKRTAEKSAPRASAKRRVEPAAKHRMVRRKVNWVEVDYIDPVKAHGVEFRHVADPNTLLAFIIGFDFMHARDATATVEILRADSNRLRPPQRTMLRRKVLSVLRKRGRWRDNGQIRTWVNG